jgi:hypothetical protein
VKSLLEVRLSRPNVRGLLFLVDERGTLANISRDDDGATVKATVLFGAGSCATQVRGFEGATLASTWHEIEEACSQ